MVVNLFELSIERNEHTQFFRGEGQYFSLNRSSGEHAYLLNLTKYVSPSIAGESNGETRFKAAFKSYINSVNPTNVDDVETVLRNIYCIGLGQKRRCFPDNNVFKEQNVVLIELFKLLEQCVLLANKRDAINLLEDYHEYFIDVGFLLLSALIFQLLKA